MAKTAGGVRGGNTLGLRNEIGKDSAILKYTGKGKEYGQVGLMGNGNYYGVFGGVKGSSGGLQAQRKEFKTEKDVLSWMKRHGFIP